MGRRRGLPPCLEVEPLPPHTTAVVVLRDEEHGLGDPFCALAFAPSMHDARLPRDLGDEAVFQRRGRARALLSQNSVLPLLPDALSLSLTLLPAALSSSLVSVTLPSISLPAITISPSPSPSPGPRTSLPPAQARRKPPRVPPLDANQPPHPPQIARDSQRPPIE